MKKYVWFLVMCVASLGLFTAGCSVTIADDDDSSPEGNSNTHVENLEVSCWTEGVDNYWMFYAVVTDDDGPQDIVSTTVEVIDGSFSVIYDFELDVISAEGEFCSEFGTTISDVLDCVECQNYGFRVIAMDESYNEAEKTFPGDICSATSGHLPVDYVCPGSSSY